MIRRLLKNDISPRLLSLSTNKAIVEGYPLLQLHILHAIKKFLRQYKINNQYDNMSLFSLAQIMSYGMHRRICWKESRNNGSLQFYRIDEDETLKQAQFVFSAIKVFHDILYKNSANNFLRFKSYKNSDLLMCDLFDKLAAVVLIKSSINTATHESNRIKQLSEIVTSWEERKACLELVYRYETSDQKRVLSALLDLYITQSSSRFVVRCHCINLMQGVSFKCGDLLSFFSSRSDQSNLQLLRNTSMADFLQSDPELDIAEIKLNDSPSTTTATSLFKDSKSILKKDHTQTTRSRSPSYDPVFDREEWRALAVMIETERSQILNAVA